MNSLKALAPSWIWVILLGTLTGGIPSNDTTDVIAPAQANHNVTHDVSLPTNNTAPQPTNQTAVPPTFVVKSVTGQPCLLATVNVSIRVSYYVNAANSKREYVAFKDIKVPSIEDSVNSMCSENKSVLALEWGNSTFSLNMTFTSHGKSEHSVHSNWTLDSIAFGYDLSNFIAFPGSSEVNYVNEETNGLAMFNTEIGHTKECDKVMKTTLGKGDSADVIIFEYVKLAAFNLTSQTFPEETEECQVKSSSIRDEDIMVPLIIACALSFVIIVVVVAYAISRKVQEVRDQSQYKPMP